MLLNSVGKEITICNSRSYIVRQQIWPKWLILDWIGFFIKFKRKSEVMTLVRFSKYCFVSDVGLNQFSKHCSVPGFHTLGCFKIGNFWPPPHFLVDFFKVKLAIFDLSVVPEYRKFSNPVREYQIPDNHISRIFENTEFLKMFHSRSKKN